MDKPMPTGPFSVARIIFLQEQTANAKTGVLPRYNFSLARTR
jgi:hypothetical protein